MYRRVLVAFDQRGCEVVLPTAARLASRSDGEVRILSIHADTHDAVGGPLRYLRRMLRAYGPSNARVTTTIGSEQGGDELTKEADGWDADLIVLPIDEAGHLADYCVHHSSRPVLLLRGASENARQRMDPMAVRRVVIPLDGSALSETALSHGKSMATLLRLPITLVRVVPAPPVHDSKPESRDDLHERLLVKETASAYLDRAAATLRVKGFDVATQIETGDDPAMAILREAGRDLLVMTTHARKGIMKALLGSVTAAVIRGAEGPVLVLPPRIAPEAITA